MGTTSPATMSGASRQTLTAEVDAEAFNRLVENLNTVSLELSQVLQGLNAGANGNAGDLQRRILEQTLALVTSLQRLSAGSIGELNKTLQETRTTIGEVNRTLAGISPNLKAAVQNLDKVLGDIQKVTSALGPDGTGAVAKLLNDPKLAQQLQTSMTALESTLRQVNEETVPKVNGLLDEGKRTASTFRELGERFNAFFGNLRAQTYAGGAYRFGDEAPLSFPIHNSLLNRQTGNGTRIGLTIVPAGGEGEKAQVLFSGQYNWRIVPDGKWLGGKPYSLGLRFGVEEEYAPVVGIDLYPFGDDGIRHARAQATAKAANQDFTTPAPDRPYPLRVSLEVVNFSQDRLPDLRLGGEWIVGCVNHVCPYVSGGAQMSLYSENPVQPFAGIGITMGTEQSGAFSALSAAAPYAGR